MRLAVSLVFVDSTKGWIVTDSGNESDAPTAKYVTATGGTVTTCGNFKRFIHLQDLELFVYLVQEIAGGSNTVSLFSSSWRWCRW